ncbi:uncharacterized protein LOC141665244 [Apium graveolens]|uniref:uncharacterized protein LOC141665244 n=1 Tax=Apium graveolens TaxID=4045 RepID=UPI003D7A3A49
MASGSKFSFSDMQNPLFLHPSDNPLSISVTKLQGSDDYLSWKRSMEIQLSSKRKLGFVHGTEIRSATDQTEVVQWDMCNSMAYGMKQNGSTIVDYFTSLSSEWEELESMNQLPAVSTVGEDISKLLTVIHTQKEEAKLFQFLNGLDDIYTPQRSQLLMITPLPSVEMACAAIQQEESQKEVLKGAYSYDPDVSAMLSKTFMSADRVSVPNARWNNSRAGASPKGPPAANVAMGSTSSDPTQQPIIFSPQQLQQLLQLIPSQSLSHDYNEDALESPFSGMITCNNVGVETGRWIMDTGATDHMTADFDLLHNVKSAKPHVTVNLPTGATTMVTHLGDVKLASGLKLLNVLYVPVFTHNLLSINKLSRDNDCYVVFSPTECTIIDAETHVVKSKGIVSNGLYHLSPSNAVSENNSQHSFAVLKTTLAGEYTLWYNRLGHAPVSKLKFIECIKHCIHGADKVCLTCPMVKFTRLPFSLSESHASKPFDLVHTDIWGPYKVCIRQKFRYFLTILDDYSRVTWLYLLQHKSDYLKTMETFHHFVQRQFGSSIKVIRSDNAKEFDDAECHKFFQM